MFNTDTSAPSPVPPYRYDGGNLGLARSEHPTINFVDANDVQWRTTSVEYVLRQVPHFTGDERGPVQLLAAAAIHFGLDAWDLIKGYGTLEEAMHEVDVRLGRAS